MDLIIYHAKCPDGWCAAFVAKKKYPEAELLGLDHGTPVPFDQVRDKDVLVVDFSWPVREDNIKLHEIAKSFHIYDHHKTAKERLEGLDFVTFDMNRSGAGITWDYLFGKDSEYFCLSGNPILDGMSLDELRSAAANNSIVDMYKFALFSNEIARREKLIRPWYVNYVEDRDLWRHDLHDSRAVNAFLMSLPMTVEAWNRVDDMKTANAGLLGRPVISHIERYVTEAANEAQYGIFQMPDGRNYSVAVVNAPYMNCSEVGNILARQADVGLTWFERADGQAQFSLRSEGDIDVSEIAKLYIGGGHMHAAGFRLQTSDARLLLDYILGR